MSGAGAEVYIGKEGAIKKATEARVIPPFSVKYKDVFNLKNLYVMMHELLLEEGWLGWEDSERAMAGHNDMEVLYSENVFQKGIHHGGKEFWIWWRLHKKWERGSSYFDNILNVDWHVVGSHDVELVHQGKKMKAQKAELEIFFSPKIVSDVGLGWQKHPFLKHVKTIYEQRVMNAYLDKREKELWRDAYRIQSKLKSYLNLRIWQQPGEPFHARSMGFEGSF